MTIRNGIDGLLRCECGQTLSEDLDVRTDIDGNRLAVCPNCGNCAQLEEEHEAFAAIVERYRRAQLRHFQFLRQQDIAPGDPGKFKREYSR